MIYIIVFVCLLSIALNVYLIVNRKKGTVSDLLKDLEDKLKEKANYAEIKSEIEKIKDKI